jgi:hypothetical protein
VLQHVQCHREKADSDRGQLRSTVCRGWACTDGQSYSFTSDEKEMNPKSTIQRDSYSRAYSTKGDPRNFIVTNDLRLRIFHFSLANTLQVIRASNIPMEKLVEKELSLDRTQVILDLLLLSQVLVLGSHQVLCLCVCRS